MTPRSGGYGRALLLGAIAVALGFIAIVPGRSAILNAGGPAAGSRGPGGQQSGPLAGPSQGPGQHGQTRTGNSSQYRCDRINNGGATDRFGVAASQLRLASTVVQSGPGASFLAASPTGMQAVLRKQNTLGGVCGRILTLKLVDDSWNAQNGHSFIDSFIKDGNFALPVVPSSEGLTAAIDDINAAGIPVVGTDGMLKQQYTSPWIWPVATATVSTMRIMAKYAYAQGIRRFGIVFDSRYKFGVEGSDAFRGYVKTLPGAKILASVPIEPARASYSSEIQRFNSSCNGNCEFVAMLLEPGTALTWIAGRPQMGSKMTSGAQTLFNQEFASNCGQPCQGMLVWTGYNPPIGDLAGRPDVAEYVRDVKNVDPKIDITNQFLEGAYLGMKIFIQALQKVGPVLTRANLQHVLNTTCFTSDITSKLCWSPTDRFANKRAQAFSIVVAQGSFAGFKNEQTGFIADPELS